MKNQKKKRYHQKVLKKDLLVVFLILTLPLLLNLHNYVSSNHDTISLLGFHYQLKGYSNLSNLVFYFFIDFVKFAYITLWFVTCKNNWYKALIALLILQSYLLVYTFNYEFHFIEHPIRWIQRLGEIGLGALLALLLLPFLFHLRKRFNTYQVFLQIEKKLEEQNIPSLNTKGPQKDWFFFCLILFIVIAYFGTMQYIYYLKTAPNFDNSPIGLYQSKTTLFFALTARITPLLYLSVWLITCRYWWYHALSIPVCVYLLQIIIALQVNSNEIDKNDYIRIFPLAFLVIVVLYFTRQKILTRIGKFAILEEVESKIKQIKKKKLDS